MPIEQVLTIAEIEIWISLTDDALPGVVSGPDSVLESSTINCDWFIRWPQLVTAESTRDAAME